MDPIVGLLENLSTNIGPFRMGHPAWCCRSLDASCNTSLVHAGAVEADDIAVRVCHDSCRCARGSVLAADNLDCSECKYIYTLHSRARKLDYPLKTYEDLLMSAEATAERARIMTEKNCILTVCLVGYMLWCGGVMERSAGDEKYIAIYKQ